MSIVFVLILYDFFFLVFEVIVVEIFIHFCLRYLVFVIYISHFNPYSIFHIVFVIFIS